MKTLTGPTLPTIPLPDYDREQKEKNESRSAVKWNRLGVHMGYPCIVCGTYVGPNPSAQIHVCGGGGEVADPRTVHEEGSREEAGCLAFYPIGPSCLKRFPQLRPYAVPKAGATREADL